MAVIWTVTAVRGISRAYNYIFDFNPQAAMHVAKTLRAEGDSLVNFPHRGRTLRGTNMRELVTAYPYIIRYRIVGDDVVIMRVRHSARRPTNP